MLSDTKSAMEPHRPRTGPWFEGWYARTLDQKSGRSLAVIVGSYVPQGVTPSPSQSFPGYLGILYSQGDGQPMRTWTAFPKESRTTLNGLPVTSDPNILKREDAPYAWEVPGYGSWQNRRIHLEIPGQVAVSMELEEGTPWEKSGWPLGPEWIGSGLPLPLHWYVGSLHSPSQYTINWRDDDGTIRQENGASVTHLEKNWGAAFPKAWNWLQGMTTDGAAQMVLGGGTLGIMGVDLKAWLAGYRSPSESWDLRFSDPGVRIEVEGDSCLGSFHFTAKRLDLEVEIKAQAPITSFGPVAVPTAGGFEPNRGIESFSSTTEVWTYRPSLWGRRLTDHRVFRHAALEFGADAYKTSCPGL